MFDLMLARESNKMCHFVSGGLDSNHFFHVKCGLKLLKCGLAAECSAFIHSFLQQEQSASAGVTPAVLHEGAVSIFTCAAGTGKLL